MTKTQFFIKQSKAYRSFRHFRHFLFILCIMLNLLKKNGNPYAMNLWHQILAVDCQVLDSNSFYIDQI